MTYLPSSNTFGINQWRRRLQAVVQENGEHVELNTSATSCRHLYSITLFFVEWRK